jgi:hypothetical protein
VPLEPLFAGDAAKMIGFTVESDLEFGCFFVQNYAANGIFRQFLGLNLNQECDFCLLLIVVKKRKIWWNEVKMLARELNIFVVAFV